jgi:hypothetical protein
MPSTPWLTVTIPPAEVTEVIETVAEAFDVVLVALEAVNQVLEILKNFLIDIGDPTKIAMTLVLTAVQNAIEDIKNLGLYALFIYPDPQQELRNTKGGITQFEKTITSALFDPQDAGRPQFSPNAVAGMVVFAISNNNIMALLQQLQKIWDLFGFRKEIYMPAPGNVRVVPLGETGNPILDIEAVFQQRPSKVQLQWSLKPRGSLFDAFVPQLFQIERAADRFGDIEYAEYTETINGQEFTRSLPILDSSLGIQPYPILRRFQKVAAEDGTALQAAGGFFTGEYRYVIDTDELAPGQGAFYRVVPGTGTLDYIEGPKDAFGRETKQQIQDGKRGAPSAPVFVRMPKLPPDFDFYSVLLNTYQAGYMLRLDIPPDPQRLEFPDGAADFRPGQGLMQDGYIPQATMRRYTYGKEDDLREFFLKRARGFTNLTASKYLANESAQDAFRSAIEPQLEELVDFVENASMEVLDTGQVVLDPEPSDAIQNAISQALIISQAAQQEGAPPDWVSFRPFQDLGAGAMGQLFGRIEAKLQGIIDSLNGSVAVLEDFITMVQSRIDIITAFVEEIERIVDLILSFSVSLSMLAISPDEGGIGRLVNDLLSAEDKPDWPAEDHVAGCVLLLGTPGVGDFAAVGEGTLGGLGAGEDAAGALSALFGA